MGDIADYIIDHVMNDDIRPGGYYNRVDAPPLVCKHCGSNKVHWEQRGGKWRLCDEDQKEHICLNHL